MDDNRQPFDLALTVTRAGNLFTTHTPVEAGFDRFAPGPDGEVSEEVCREGTVDLIRRPAGAGTAESATIRPNHSTWLIWPFAAAARSTASADCMVRSAGDSFRPLFPSWPETEVPVTLRDQRRAHAYVGLRRSGPAVGEVAAERTAGAEHWKDMEEDFARRRRLRSLATARRQPQISRSNTSANCYARQIAAQGASPEELAQAAQVLDADTLTLGFARRFATYKRPNLLLHDPQRLANILTNRERPVQLVLAGKAHPQDLAGQEMIRQWIEFARRPEVRSRVVFLSDYDVLMAEHLVQGVDVWVNTPRRPWEASGTSGMKVLVNGGLNLSELDGWWAEAYSPEVGWAIGDGREHGDDPAWDAAEAESSLRTARTRGYPGILFARRSREFLAAGLRACAKAWPA